ncbi:hypothetical protein PG989_002046 [Apiospora arundinis]
MFRFSLKAKGSYMRGISIKVGTPPQDLVFMPWASRMWSIFWGRMWNSRPLDGSVVLGDYDRDKTIDANYTQRLDYSDTTGCWTGMKTRGLTGINGAPTELHWGALTYFSSPENKFFDEDLSISLSPGLSVRVPKDQFMVPKAYMDRNGTRLFNRNYREFLLSPLADGGNQASLGRYFLTAAYLMVDHDAGTFMLCRANPASSSSLVPVVVEKRAADGCGGDLPGVVQPSATVNSNSESSESNNARLSSGVIAGIAIGAAVGWQYWVSRDYFCSRYAGSSMAYAPSGSSAVPAQQQVTAPQELHGKTVWAQDRGFKRPADNVPYELDSNSYSPGTSH